MCPSARWTRPRPAQAARRGERTRRQAHRHRRTCAAVQPSESRPEDRTPEGHRQAGHAVTPGKTATVTGERSRPERGERRRGSTSAPRPRRSCREDCARHRKRPRPAPGARRARPCQPCPSARWTRPRPAQAARRGERTRRQAHRRSRPRAIGQPFASRRKDRTPDGHRQAGHAVTPGKTAAVTGERRHHRRGSTSAPRPRRSCREDFARHRKRPRSAPGARRARPCQPCPSARWTRPRPAQAARRGERTRRQAHRRPCPRAIGQPFASRRKDRTPDGHRQAGHAVTPGKTAAVTGERSRPERGERRRGSTSAPRPRRSCREDCARHRKRPRPAPGARRARPCQPCPSARRTRRQAAQRACLPG